MKNLISTLVSLVVLIILGASFQVSAGQNSKSQEIIKQNMIKKIVAQELPQFGESKPKIVFKEINKNIFSESQRNQLTKGQTIQKKSWKLNILNFRYYFGLPVLYQSAVYNLGTYKNIQGKTQKINTEQIIEPAANVLDISLISFYLPILIVLLIPIFMRTETAKLLVTALIVMVDLSVLSFIFLGVILSNYLASGIICELIVSALLILTLIGLTILWERVIWISGIIIGICAAVFSARLYLLGFSPLSPGFVFVWEYVGFYILAGVLGIVIMLLKKSPKEEDEAIYININ